MKPHFSADALRVTFVAVILVSSAQTLWSAISVATVDVPIAALAAAEIAAVIAFWSHSWRRQGAWALLAIFALAFVASLAQGELAARFVLYSAIVLFLSGVDPVSLQPEGHRPADGALIE